MKRCIAIFLLFFFLAGCAAPATPSAPGREDGRVVIALIDTGISESAIDPARILPGHNYVTGSDDTADRLDHGTAVASVIVGCGSAGVEGAAEFVYLVPLVAADRGENGVERADIAVLARAVREAVDQYAADIVNVSLGVKTDDPELRAAVEYAEEQGVLVVAAVGNSGGEELYYPAAYETVLAVGSHDKNGEVSDFTQRSGTADILAPGEDIWMANREGNTYGARGTSYATGFVSAGAALLLENDPSLCPAEVREKLIAAARMVDDWAILELERLK